jgi:hypothetical protein
LNNERAAQGCLNHVRCTCLPGHDGQGASRLCRSLLGLDNPFLSITHTPFLQQSFPVILFVFCFPIIVPRLSRKHLQSSYSLARADMPASVVSSDDDEVCHRSVTLAYINEIVTHPYQHRPSSHPSPRSMSYSIMVRLDIATLDQQS